MDSLVDRAVTGWTRERVRLIESSNFCDFENVRGGGWGAMYRKIRGRWVKYTDADYAPAGRFTTGNPDRL